MVLTKREFRKFKKQQSRQALKALRDLQTEPVAETQQQKYTNEQSKMARIEKHKNAQQQSAKSTPQQQPGQKGTKHQQAPHSKAMDNTSDEPCENETNQKEKRVTFSCDDHDDDGDDTYQVVRSKDAGRSSSKPRRSVGLHPFSKEYMQSVCDRSDTQKKEYRNRKRSTSRMRAMNRSRHHSFRQETTEEQTEEGETNKEPVKPSPIIKPLDNESKKTTKVDKTPPKARRRTFSGTNFAKDDFPTLASDALPHDRSKVKTKLNSPKQQANKKDVFEKSPQSNIKSAISVPLKAHVEEAEEAQSLDPETETSSPSPKTYANIVHKIGSPAVKSNPAALQPVTESDEQHNSCDANKQYSDQNNINDATKAKDKPIETVNKFDDFSDQISSEEKQNLTPPSTTAEMPSRTIKPNVLETIPQINNFGIESKKASIEDVPSNKDAHYLADPAILEMRFQDNILDDNKNIAWNKPCLEKLESVEQNNRVENEPTDMNAFFPSHHNQAAYPLLGQFLYAYATTDNNELPPPPPGLDIMTPDLTKNEISTKAEELPVPTIEKNLISTPETPSPKESNEFNQGESPFRRARYSELPSQHSKPSAHNVEDTKPVPPALTSPMPGWPTVNPLALQLMSQQKEKTVSPPQEQRGNRELARIQDAGYQSGFNSLNNSSEDKLIFNEPAMFVKNWVPQSKRWSDKLSRVAMSQHTGWSASFCSSTYSIRRRFHMLCQNNVLILIYLKMFQPFILTRCAERTKYKIKIDIFVLTFLTFNILLHINEEERIYEKL